MKREYTKETYERVFELDEKGYNASEIGRLLNIPNKTISHWLKRERKPPAAWDESDWQRCLAWRKHVGEINRKLNLGKRQSRETIEKRRKSLMKGEIPHPDVGRKHARQMYSVPRGKEIHHIDGDTNNNESSNIMFVTRGEHMVIDGRLDKLQEGRRRYQEKLRNKAKNQ